MPLLSEALRCDNDGASRNAYICQWINMACIQTKIPEEDSALYESEVCPRMVKSYS